MHSGTKQGLRMNMSVYRKVIPRKPQEMAAEATEGS